MHEHHHRHHRHEEFQPGRQRWEGPDAGPEREPRPGRRGHHHRGGPRGRAQRGDVRAAVLILLGEEPMHGYQLMQAISARTNGAWKVSPGAIYPTLALLEDEGLVSTESAGGRKLATLTESGRALLADPDTAPTDPFEAMTESGRVSGREIFEALAMASRTIARTGSKAQIEAARAVLERARRDLYLILADGPTDEPQS